MLIRTWSTHGGRPTCATTLTTVIRRISTRVIGRQRALASDIAAFPTFGHTLPRHRIAPPWARSRSATPIDVPRERAFELARRPRQPARVHGPSSWRSSACSGSSPPGSARLPASGCPSRECLDRERRSTELDPPHRIFERGRGSRLDRMPDLHRLGGDRGPRAGGCEVRVSSGPSPRTRSTCSPTQARASARFYRRGWDRVAGAPEEDAGGGSGPRSASASPAAIASGPVEARALDRLPPPMRSAPRTRPCCPCVAPWRSPLAGCGGEEEELEVIEGEPVEPGELSYNVSSRASSIPTTSRTPTTSRAQPQAPAGRGLLRGVPPGP